MDYLQFESPFWFLIGVLVLTKSVALTLFIYKRRTTRKKSPEKSRGSSDEAGEGDRGNMAVEIERLCEGGGLDGPSLRRMSAEDRALFEVQLIDALTKCSREDQHRLRSTLIKHGYDENCARRVMSENVSDRIRAKTLLGLLRPQSQGRTADLALPPKAEAAQPARPEGGGSNVNAENEDETKVNNKSKEQKAQ